MNYYCFNFHSLQKFLAELTFEAAMQSEKSESGMYSFSSRVFYMLIIEVLHLTLLRTNLDFTTSDIYTFCNCCILLQEENEYYFS